MGKRKTVGGLAIAGLAVWLLAGSKKHQDDHAAVPAPRAVAPPVVAPVADAAPVRTRRSWRRRAATTLAYTALFFAGAALTAGAGNEVAHVDAGSTDPAVATDVLTTDATTDVTTTDAGTTPTTTDTTTTTTTTEDVDPSNATPVTTTAAVTTTEAAPALPAATPSEDAVAPAAPTPAPAAAPPVQHAHTVAAPAPAAPQSVQPVASPFPVIAFDPQAWLVDHPGTPAGDAAVAIAERYLGVPYVWGGSKPSTGFDCSGLTQYVYAQLGVWLPHYAAAQFLAYPRLDPSQLQAGDLVFFEPKADGPGHVAIYAGNGQIVEAPHTGATVRVGSLAGAAASLGFLGAVRPTASGLPVVRRLSDVVRATPDTAPGIAGALLR